MPSTTLKLQLGPSSPSISRTRRFIRIKSKAHKPRQPLSEIINSIPLDDEAPEQNESPKISPGLVTPPATPRSSRSMDTSPSPEPEEELDRPGPFIHVRVIREEFYSRVVVVRDMQKLDDRRLMCAKIMNKDRHGQLLAKRELKAYKALSAASENHEEWVLYVMRLEAALEDTSHIYFMMELMNCDLMDVMMDWKLETRQFHRRKWVAQVATGLAAIHASGIIHRDLKPENILIDFRFNARITDFGCSFVDPGGKPVHAFGAYSDEPIGTWPYMAPEVLSLRNNSSKSSSGFLRKYSLPIDYWALGMIVFELECDFDRPEACVSLTTRQLLFLTASQSLFRTEHELWAFTKYRPIEHKGQSFFESMRKITFQKDVESLLEGLLRPTPYMRFGDHELRRHPYFRNPHGYNEFSDIERMGRALNRIPVGYDVPLDRLKPDGTHEVHAPVVCDFPGVNYSWINPNGIWGPSGAC
ncbi:hypothetical protein H0H81_005102 [Sphagnurus paluster]|uniref:non-specific serine/threonine protein kinase n=1 Tax=Sphagnurus paluster TaxID=117069 RepID=A0A9P7KJA0_9AGAR|nr:hypothetical protein H0H81_005102 [Sphagnurus paluster]